MTATITKIQKMFFALGTVNSVTLYDEAHEQAFCEVKSRVLQLNDMLNAYDERSEVSAINRNAGVKSVRVSPETFALIEDSVRFSVLSKGLFDITTRPLSLIWKNAIKNKSLPDYIEVMRAALLSSYRDIILNRDDMSGMLRRRGQELDLGAIAKGYAADEAKRILTEHGVSEAIINLGGTVINLGEMRKIGLQKPFEETGTPFAYLAVGERAVVSSGIYEQAENRLSVRDGRRQRDACRQIRRAARRARHHGYNDEQRGFGSASQAVQGRGGSRHKRRQNHLHGGLEKQS